MKKDGSEKRRISATGGFLWPLLKQSGTVSAVREATSRKSARNGAPPVVLFDVKKTNALYFAVEVAHPPDRLTIQASKAVRGWPDGEADERETVERKRNRRDP